MPAGPEATDVVRALQGGAGTLDALAARLGGVGRDQLLWAVDDAVDRGWVRRSGDGCVPEGLCGGSAPVVYATTDAGRTVARACG